MVTGVEMGYFQFAGKTAELGQLHHPRRYDNDSHSMQVSTRFRSCFSPSFSETQRSFARCGAMALSSSILARGVATRRDNGRALQFVIPLQ